MGISAFGASGIKPGVCTSTTRPSAPYEGMMIYETDTDKTLVYNGSSWLSPNSTSSNGPGLEFITSASWASGGTLSVNNCFTSTYSSYRIMVRNAKHATTSVNILLRFRASGTDTSAGYYWGRRYVPMGGTGGGDTGASNSADIVPGIVAAVSNAGSGVIDVHDPQKSAVTSCTFQGTWTITTGESSSGAGFLNNTTSYDGFTLIANTGNFTSLDVVVYGYRGS